MKTAIIHDWLVSLGGGERVLEAVLELFPSPIYTLIASGKMLKDSPFAGNEVHSSFIQKLPFSEKLYRNYFPFFPRAIEQFDLDAYDVILSNSHTVAKGALVNSSQLHLCYCFSPVRSAWDLYHQYLGEIGWLKRQLAAWFLHDLREWDVATVNRVDHFAVISHTIARRVKKIYGRESVVIYPPAATHLFKPAAKKDDFFLTVSRLVPYKKIDLLVEAFSLMPEKKLVVIGDGPEMKKIREKAGKNIELLGYQSDVAVREYVGKAKGFLFAAEEDYGIVVVEAQAAGTPVIAYGRGGATETIVDGKTGLFFQNQTVADIVDAVRRFGKMEFNPDFLCAHADNFSEAKFKENYRQFVEEKWEAFCEDRYSCRR